MRSGQARKSSVLRDGRTGDVDLGSDPLIFLVGHQGVFVELSRETGGDFSISTSLFVVDVFSAATALLLLPIIPEGIHSFGWPSGNQMWQQKSAIIHSSCFFPTDVRCAHGFPGFSHRGAGFAIAMMTTGTLSLT